MISRKKMIVGPIIGLMLFITVAVWMKGRQRSIFVEQDHVSTFASPSGEVAVEIIDRKGLDYNLDMYVTWKGTSIRKCIYQSPDEGLPIERRVIFAADHAAFAIVGRNYFVDEPYRLKDGQCLYLLYDWEADKLWCNAKQDSKVSRWTLEDAIRLGFKRDQILGDNAEAVTTQAGRDSLNH